MTASIDAPPRRPAATLVRLLWLSTLVLVLISVAMVTRRTLSLFGLVPAPSALSESSPLDGAFARYAPLTMAHIVPGLIFVVLGPLQFVRTLRIRRPRLHRWMGRVVLTSGLATGVTALAMTTQMAIGGRYGEGRHGAVWRHFPDRFDTSLRVYPSTRGGSPSRMDDSRVRLGAGGRHRPTHRRRLLRDASTDESDGAGVFRNRVLAWLHSPHDRCGDLDQLHATASGSSRSRWPQSDLGGARAPSIY
jgi:Predicted membrane protein (DUF2306)